jgi:cytochrome c1
MPQNYYNNIQDLASNSSTVRKALWTNKGLGAKRNQGWSKEGLERFGAYCKAVEKNHGVVNLQKVDTDYWKAKQAEIGKDEERKRKRLETRDNREKGWEVTHVDEWSNEEEPHEPQEIIDMVQQAREQEDNSSDDEEETLR